MCYRPMQKLLVKQATNAWTSIEDAIKDSRGIPGGMRRDPARLHRAQSCTPWMCLAAFRVDVALEDLVPAARPERSGSHVLGPCGLALKPSWCSARLC